jgi:RecB family endonuclease NucS
MRLVVARCSARYSGRLNAHLPLATRLVLVKADGSVLLHSDGGSYKPLNWMSPPCTLAIGVPDAAAAERGAAEIWTVQHSKSDDRLVIEVHEVLHDSAHELGVDPGLVKDGVEAHLQELLAAQIGVLGSGHTLVRREFPTAIGPVDILARDANGGAVAVEIKRRGDIDGSLSRVPAASRHVAVEVKRHATIGAVEQLSRYLVLLNRDSALAPVRGVLAALSVTQQARTLAEDRGIEVLLLDYDAMRGVDHSDTRLF